MMREPEAVLSRLAGGIFGHIGALNIRDDIWWPE